MTKSIVRWGYPPLMLIAGNGLAMAVIAGGGSHLLLVALLLAAIAASFSVERLIPYATDWNVPHDDVDRDVAHALINESIAIGSVLALPALASVARIVNLWPQRLPFVVQVLGAILVFDFGITIAHWLSHRWGPLWRLHAVHHSVTRAYGLNGLMKHPLHLAVELSFGIAPLLVIGLPQRVAWALAFAVAIQLLMQHSNADYRVGPLRGWLSLNQGHRFHHLKWGGIGDVNFGLFTLIYDRLLLKTFSYDPTKQFTSDDLGIATQPDFPSRYLSQLTEPFRPRHQVRETSMDRQAQPDQRPGRASVATGAPRRSNRATVAGTGVPAPDDVTAELVAREPIFHKPAFGITRNAYLAQTAEDYWEVGASGRVYDREVVIAELLRRGKVPGDEHWVLSDAECRRLGPDTYALTYRLDQAGRVTRRVTLWRREADGWKILYHQGTLVPDP